MCAHRRGFIGELQAHKPVEHLNELEQLAPVCRGVHGNENVREAVDGVHIAACRHPYHFSEWLRDSSGDKVYLVLVYLAGRFEDALVHKGAGGCVHGVTSFVVNRLNVSVVVDICLDFMFMLVYNF